MSKLRRHIMMQAQGGGILPREYQRVEYLLGGGGAYLIIPATVGNQTGIKLVGGCSTLNYSCYFGSENSPYNNTCIAGSHGGNGSYIYRGFNSAFSYSGDPEYAAKKEISLNYLNDGQLIVDTYGYATRQMATPSLINQQDTFVLFSRNINNSLNNSWCPHATYIYDFILTQDTEEEMHLIPCYRKSDNEPGMYDIVNNVFYTNSGTRSFTVGDPI